MESTGRRIAGPPELDRLQATLSALMTYRGAAGVTEQMFPVGAGKDKETMRRHTLRAGMALQDCTTIRPETTASAIGVTLDSTFIRSCELGASERARVADRRRRALAGGSRVTVVVEDDDTRGCSEPACGAAAAEIPLRRTDPLQLLPRWLYADLEGIARLRDGAQQRDLRQPGKHSPRRSRSVGAQWAAPAFDGAGIVCRGSAKSSPVRSIGCGWNLVRR